MEEWIRGAPQGAPTVLLVTADREGSLRLAKHLRERDWTVVFAADGVQGLQLAIREQPDAVVLSMQLPAGGGRAVIERLRRSLHTTATPVIAMARNGVDCESALEAGAQACLEDPIDPEALVHALHRVSGRGVVVTHAPEGAIANPERLTALDATGLLDAEVDPDLDWLTTIAAGTLGVPVALLSLVDRDRQFFATHVGLPEPWATARQTPLSHSFCQWVVSGREPVMVEDARQHPVLKHNLAVRDIGVIAYAGVPMATASGQHIGSFCGIDTRPRVWSDRDRETLSDLVAVAGAVLTIRDVDSAGDVAGDPDEAVRVVTDGIRAASKVLRRERDALEPDQTAHLLSALDRMNDALAVLIGTLRTGPESASAVPSPSRKRATG
ncbi:MAG: response regulator [Gemmatimonadota bacterium]|nr:response regulator [Gemmatimonadota bacterium]